MSAPDIKYELLAEEQHSKTPVRQRLQHHRHRHHVHVQVCLLVFLCAASSVAVFITWTIIYRHHVNVPPTPDAFQPLYADRVNHLLATLQTIRSQTNQPATNDTTLSWPSNASAIKHYDRELIYPSPLGNFLADHQQLTANATTQRLVCYFVGSAAELPAEQLRAADIHPLLCTHLNIGMATVDLNDQQIRLDATLGAALRQSIELRQRNPAIRLMLWIGGGDADARDAFAVMVQTHASRMRFVRSVLATLAEFRLDGCDVDWEFPSGGGGGAAHQRERQHFVQLLHEIRRAYQRGRHTYELSVAVAAPESIARLAYYVREINAYVDYANVMTYDFHAWSRWTPFTGLNAPLAARREEVGSYLGTLNIAASVRFWEEQGMRRDKIVVGLPTYGHSFRLVNMFNAEIMSPASGFGDLGSLGFVTYADVCWFMRNNYFLRRRFDAEACSPFVSDGIEWLSYENEQSIACKTNFVRTNGYGGVMVFSLNADDWRGSCDGADNTTGIKLPLARKVYATLFGHEVPDV